MSQPVYVLNLFNVSNKKQYLTYSRRSAKEVAAHGGRVVALGIKPARPEMSNEKPT